MTLANENEEASLIITKWGTDLAHFVIPELHVNEFRGLNELGVADKSKGKYLKIEGLKNYILHGRWDVVNNNTVTLNDCILETVSIAGMQHSGIDTYQQRRWKPFSK